MEHKDVRCRDRFREDLVLEVKNLRSSGVKLAVIAKQLSISMPTIYRWLRLPDDFFDTDTPYNSLPCEVKQILIGSLLGDGSLNWSYNGSAAFRESHCLAQEDYLRWKASMLTILQPEIYQSGSSWRLYTSRTRSLHKLRMEFYPLGQKVLPRGLLGELNVLGLAVWWQDDGHYEPSKITGRGIRNRRFPHNGKGFLHTQSFSMEDVEWLASDFFPCQFDLHPKQGRMARKGAAKCWILRFNGEDMLALSQLIKPVLRESMRYKVA